METIMLRILLADDHEDRKSTRLNSSHDQISYAVFCLKKKTHEELGRHRGPHNRPGLAAQAMVQVVAGAVDAVPLEVARTAGVGVVRPGQLDLAIERD